MKGFSATSSIRPIVDLRLNGGREILIFSLKYFESLWCAAFFFLQTEAD